MPSHKAQFKWRRSGYEATGQRTVTNEFGTFKLGGIHTTTRSCSRGGIFVCKMVTTLSYDDLSNITGVWRLERPDGSVHSHGKIEKGRGINITPSTETLEEIAAGG